MFAGVYGIALHAMHGNRAPSCGKGEVSWIFSRCGGTWVIFSNYSGNRYLKLVYVQRRQDSCLVTRDTSAISTRLARAIWTLFEVRRET